MTAIDILLLWRGNMLDSGISQYKMNFTRIYHNQVVPSLERLETDREKTQKTAIMLSIIVFLIIAAVIAFLCGFGTSFENTTGSILIMCLFGLIPSMAVYYFFQKNFERKIKSILMPIIMPAFGNFAWTRLAIIPEDEIRRSRLFENFDKINIDDNFAGSYKNIAIRISEAEMTYETRDSKGNRDVKVVFDGVLISLQIPKKFNCHTLVKKRAILGNSGPYDEVKLEDPEFSKQFYVNSNDQVEARYLLTTAFMQRYKNIQKAFNASKIECCFLNTNLLIAVSVSKDLFALGSLNKHLTDTKQFTIFLNEIISILEMIEELKLYQTTGL